MPTPSIESRSASKTGEGHFLRKLEQEFRLPPRIAQAIVEEAKASLEGSRELKAGQIRRYLTRYDRGGGQPLDQLPTVEVIWTLDAGDEDSAVRKSYGRVSLRRVRIQRLASEALEQGAVATQEDLSMALGVCVRTIKSDCKALETKGILVTTRGKLHGIGRGQTHKSQIVGRWLQGATYDQIVLQTHHSITSIQRYIRTFLRVVLLYRQAFAPGEIAHLVQVSRPLLDEYLTLYESYDQPECRQRLELHLNRLQNGLRPDDAPKKGDL
ncbi:MAG: DUF1670 domain-containing protein [Caldilineaceae bacterium]